MRVKELAPTEMVIEAFNKIDFVSDSCALITSTKNIIKCSGKHILKCEY